MNHGTTANKCQNHVHVRKQINLMCADVSKEESNNILIFVMHWHVALVRCRLD